MKALLFIAVLGISLTTAAQVGIGTTTPGTSAILDITSTTKGMLTPRMTAAEKTMISAPATGLLIYLTDSIPGFYFYNGTAWAELRPGVHFLGESYGGGTVFYIFDKGHHGLIAANTDQSSGAYWYFGSTVTNAIRDGLNAGLINTELIVAVLAPGVYAAGLCASYQGGSFGDWFLPSKYELNLLYLQKAFVPGIAPLYYWSSNESSNTTAWDENMGNGLQFSSSKINSVNVRAVRQF